MPTASASVHEPVARVLVEVPRYTHDNNAQESWGFELYHSGGVVVLGAGLFLGGGDVRAGS